MPDQPKPLHQDPNPDLHPAVKAKRFLNLVDQAIAAGTVTGRKSESPASNEPSKPTTPSAN